MASSSEPAAVKATLAYFNPPADGSRPYQYTEPHPVTGKPIRNWTQTFHEVEIENLRGKEGTVSLDTTGFQFITSEAKHKSFANDEEIQREYYPESIELLKKITGASKVVLFDHSMYSIFINRFGLSNVVCLD